MATKEKEEVETEREGTTDGPLLDLSDDAVKKMIKAAKKRGYVTLDELNAVLPSEETDPACRPRWRGASDMPRSQACGWRCAVVRALSQMRPW